MSFKKYGRWKRFWHGWITSYQVAHGEDCCHYNLNSLLDRLSALDKKVSMVPADTYFLYNILEPNSTFIHEMWQEKAPKKFRLVAGKSPFKNKEKRRDDFLGYETRTLPLIKWSKTYTHISDNDKWDEYLGDLEHFFFEVAEKLKDKSLVCIQKNSNRMDVEIIAEEKWTYFRKFLCWVTRGAWRPKPTFEKTYRISLRIGCE